MTTMQSVLLAVVVCCGTLFYHDSSVLVSAFQPQSSHRPLALDQSQHLLAAASNTFRSPILCNAKNNNIERDNENTNCNGKDDDDTLKCNSNSRSHRNNGISRRNAFVGIPLSATCIMAAAAAIPERAIASEFDYVPGIRPTAYLVDATIPPTLLPVSTVPKQMTVLQNLGYGYGTEKAAVSTDTINLNNMLNKAVFGTISAVQGVLASGDVNDEQSQQRPPCSFVCLGIPTVPTASKQEDSTDDSSIELALSLLSIMIPAAVNKKNTKNVAIAFSVFPYTTQSIVGSYVNGAADGTSFPEVQQQLLDVGNISMNTSSRYRPVLEYIRQYNSSSKTNSVKIDVLATAVKVADRETIYSGGIQSLEASARSKYISDPNGFIALTSDPAYKMYTDRSLLKDYSPEGKLSSANFYADRIVCHEATANFVSQYAIKKGDERSLIVTLAPTPDVRYLRGINGRIERIYNHLLASSGLVQTAKVTPNDITTILLNPNAADTLSATKQRVRLEIGTGPESLPFQTKLADYLWFSSSPKVSLLPRIMNPL